MEKKLHFCEFSTAIKGISRFHHIKKMTWSILTLLFLFVSVESWGQSNGDYQSNPTVLVNGKYYWTNPSNWQFRSGNTWGTATKYPGQEDKPNAAVTIQQGDIITLDETHNFINPSDNRMGTIEIIGVLDLIGENNHQVEFYLNTVELKVTPRLTPENPTEGGVIKFDKKIKLILPQGAVLSVTKGPNNPDGPFSYWGLVATPCSNNQEIMIGDIEIAFCKGAPGAPLTFDQLMQNNGGLQPIMNYSPVNCANPDYDNNPTINVTGQLLYDQLKYDLTNYSWVVKKDGSIPPQTNPPIYPPLPNAPFDLPINGTSSYEITLTMNGNVHGTNDAMPSATTTATLSFAPTVWDEDVDGNKIWNPVPPEYTLRAKISDENYDTGDYGSFSACFMTVASGKNLTIGADSYVKVHNGIQNDGTIIVEHQGSLLQTHTGADVNPVGAGTYIVHKQTTPYTEYDYTYWSSPVFGETIGDAFNTNTSVAAATNSDNDQFSPVNYIFWLDTENFWDGTDIDEYDDAYPWDWQSANANDIMIPGKGYIAMGAGSDFPFSTSFAGGLVQSLHFDATKVNNGDIDVAVELDASTTFGADGFTNQNLIGNPYPSAIDIHKLYSLNSSVLEGTFYFWTHGTPIDGTAPGPWDYNFTNDDYAIATTDGNNFTSVVQSANGQDVPQYIASGQSFLANVTVVGTVTFNNSMREKENNNSFFRTTNVSVDRVWLNLTNQAGLFRQVLVGFYDTATDDYQDGQDGQRLENGSYPDFYSIIPNEERRFAIQNLATFNDTKTVDLGIEIVEEGLYQIEIDHMEGIFKEGQDIYLEDTLMGIYHNFSNGAYSFTSEIGDAIEDRFVLRFTNSTLNLDDEILNSIVIYPNPSSSVFNISLPSHMDLSVEVYDVRGKTVLAKKLSSNHQIDLSGYAKGIYFARLLVDGKQVIKKIVLQ